MLSPTPKSIPKQGCSRVIGVLRDDSLPIYIHEHVLEEIVDYSETDVTRELGGFLLGGLHEDGDDKRFVEIRHFLPAVDARSDVASLTINHEVWSRMHQEWDARFPDEVVIGWHHTHPGHGVFLSGYDLFIHRHYFDQPWHVALVVDPKRHELRFFQWQGEDILDTGFLCVEAR